MTLKSKTNCLLRIDEKTWPSRGSHILDVTMHNVVVVAPGHGLDQLEDVMSDLRGGKRAHELLFF